MEDQLHHCARIAEIMELAVEEGCRGRGIGTVLFDRACALSAQAGCVQIELSCSCARHDAHRFYARKGMCLSHRRYIKTLNDDAERTCLNSGRRSAFCLFAWRYVMILHRFYKRMNTFLRDE